MTRDRVVQALLDEVRSEVDVPDYVTDSLRERLSSVLARVEAPPPPPTAAGAPPTDEPTPRAPTPEEFADIVIATYDRGVAVGKAEATSAERERILFAFDWLDAHCRSQAVRDVVNNEYSAEAAEAGAAAARGRCPHVELLAIDEPGMGPDCEHLAVYINGACVGLESYSGEPEDACRGRTFSWVEPLLKKVAEALRSNRYDAARARQLGCVADGSGRRRRGGATVTPLPKLSEREAQFWHEWLERFKQEWAARNPSPPGLRGEE